MNQSIWPDSQYLDLTSKEDTGINFYFTGRYLRLVETYGKAEIEKFLNAVSKKGYLIICYTEEDEKETARFSILVDDPNNKKVDDIIFTVKISSDSKANVDSDKKEEKRLIITNYSKKDMNVGHYLAKNGVYVKCNNIGFIYVASGGTETVYGKKFENQFDPVELFSIIGNKKNHSVPKRDKKELGKKWSKILDYAKHFTDIEDNIERTELVANTKINYSNFTSIIQDKDEDIAYKFIVDQINKEYEVGQRIDINDEFETLKPVGGTILKIDKEEKSLTITFPNQVSIEKIPSSGVISMAYANVQSRVRKKVVQSMRELSSGDYLNNIFSSDGKCLPLDTNVNLKPLEEKWAQKQKEVERIKSLPKEEQAKYKIEYPPTPTQQKAIKDGIRSKDLYLVWGPPGTGKTTVILEWVEYFARQGKRVLISSQNNKAVDNVLERLPQDIKENSIRIGNQEKIQLNVQGYSYQQRVTDLSKSLTEKVEQNEQLFTEKLKQLKEAQKIYSKYLSLINTKYKDYNESSYNKIISDYKNIIKNLNQCYKKYYEEYTTIEKNIRGCPDNKLIQYLVKLSLRGNYKRLNSKVNLYNYYASKLPKKEQLLQIEGLKEEIEKIGFPDTDMQSLFNNRDSDFSFLVFLQSTVTTNISKIGKTISQLENLLKANEEWKKELSNRNDAITSDIILSSTQVVGATCIGISTRRIFQDIDFDISIIDESGQIQLHNALVPLGRSNKAIMLGDHKQIPPSPNQDALALIEDAGSDLEKKLYENSFFDHLYSDVVQKPNKIILDTQFRMPGEIADILSEAFYENEYKSAPFKRNLPPLVDLLEKPFCLIDTQDYGKSRYENNELINGVKKRFNVLEANIIVDLVDYLLAKKLVDNKEIGIIVPYKDQLRYIRELLVERFKSKYSKEEIYQMIGTLDSFQGQERDLIIYGITRSNKRPPQAKRIGFLSELRRFNVALSRPKKQVVIVGDFKFLMECENNGDSEMIEDENSDNYSYKPSTEKDFGEFVKKMYDEVVNKKHGSLISARNLYKKIEKEGPKIGN